MPFCPVPHTSREQAWLVIGACAGALVARTLARRSIRRALLGPPEARRAHVWLVIELGVHDPSRFFAAFNQLSAATLAERGCVRYELLKETPAAAEGPSSPLDASRYTLVSSVPPARSTHHSHRRRDTTGCSHIV